MEDVRILATAGPIPPDVIVVSRSAPELVQEQLGDALIDVSTDATSRDAVESLFAGRGFVLVGRYQYDDLRKLVSARES
jgi:ABC-type phosphate/phosphonate transport system substrate-binding protein